MLRVFWLPIMLGIVACQQVTTKELAGLWELEHLEVDAVPRSANPTFLEINTNSSFAVSRVSGDQVGMYHFDSPLIRFRSEDRSWFNSQWKIKYFKEFIILRGVEEGYRGTQLRFKRIEAIPDFAEFEERVEGGICIKSGKKEKWRRFLLHLHWKGMEITGWRIKMDFWKKEGLSSIPGIGNSFLSMIRLSGRCGFTEMNSA